MKKRFKFLGVILMLALLFSLTTACSSKPGSVTKASGESASTGDTTDEAAKKAEAEARKNLSIGDVYEMRGAAVSVTAIADGGKDYEKKELLKVTVSYVNNSEEAVSFNPYDWSIQDINGARTDTAFSADGEQISSGELAPGGKVSGDIYFFAKDADKIVYTNNMFDGEDAIAMWRVN